MDLVLRTVDAGAERWDDLAELMGERGDPPAAGARYYRSEGHTTTTAASAIAPLQD